MEHQWIIPYKWFVYNCSIATTIKLFDKNVNECEWWRVKNKKINLKLAMQSALNQRMASQRTNYEMRSHFTTCMHRESIGAAAAAAADEKIRSAREKVTQAINLSNIQFHSNYESTVRKLKRFIRVEKVFGANFSSNRYLCSVQCRWAVELVGVGCAIHSIPFHVYRFSFSQMVVHVSEFIFSVNFAIGLFFYLSLCVLLCVCRRGLLFIIFICYPVCSLVIKWKSVLPSRRFEFFSVFVFFLDVSSPHSLSFSVSF